MDEVFDVAVIGAGAVGSAITRALSRYALRTVLVEAGPDVGGAASKANTAIWHTGYDAKPGSLESRLLRRSYALMSAYMPEAGIPVERLGGLLVAWNDEQQRLLPELEAQAHANGDSSARQVGRDEVYGLEPHLGPGALGGLLVPDEGILCTFTLPLALATQAVVNGAALRLNFRVSAVERDQAGTYTLTAPTGKLRCRWVINAAGVYSDAVDRLFGHRNFTITPRRGELIVFDKLARPLVRHVILPVPNAITKGVLISPTVYGNVMLGPTAEDRHDKDDTSTSRAGLEQVWKKGEAILPALLREDVTAIYAGLRPASEHSDYQLRAHPAQAYLCAGGIRSTGVSGAMGIADHVVEMLCDAGLALNAQPDFKTVRMPNIGEAGTRPYQSAAMIAADPAYGQIICHCERVTLGELQDAARSVIPARGLDGLRRRTRILQGRCQGFNCHAAAVALLAQETGQSPASLMGLEPPGQGRHAA